MALEEVQMPKVSVVLLIVCSMVSFNRMYGDAIAVTHFCKEVANEPNKVHLVVNILVKDGDNFFKAYAFDAAALDVTTSTHRTTDTNCIKDDTGSSVTVPITYDITVTTTDASHACGIKVETVEGVTYVTFLFHIYTIRDDVILDQDLSPLATCRMDDLSDIELQTAQLESSGRRPVILQRQLDGGFLNLIDDENRAVDVARVGDKVRLSAEYYPNLQKGPDNFGNDFYIGFLGIDPLSSTSASEQYVILYPRYKLPTVVAITTKYGKTTYNLVDGIPEKVVLPSDLMGCSDGGVAEIEEKGIRIQVLSKVREIGVMVCSEETGTGDCYDALPVDVLGTKYIAASMPVADESSEIMIIAHKDGTEVTVDIPDGYAHIIELSGYTTSAAGGSITFKLNERQAFHLAQAYATAQMSNVNGYTITSDTTISVICGNRNYANNHAVIQLPPTTKFGEKYVLVPVDSRPTTFIIQPVDSGNTVVTWYTSSSTTETRTISNSEYHPLEIDAPCELTADNPVSVTQVVDGPDGFGSSMVWIPPVNRWSPRYSISHPDHTLSAMAVFKSLDDRNDLYMEFGDNDPFQYQIGSSAINVAGPSGYVINEMMPFGSAGRFSFYLGGGSNSFYMTGYLKDTSEADSGAAVNLFGVKLSDRKECFDEGRRGDLLDNDCDGEIDEEILDFIDNDNDGKIDEDVMAAMEEFSGSVGMRVTDCKVSPDPAFPDDKTETLTGSDGCAVKGLFNMVGEFEEFLSDNTGSGVQPKVLRSGRFNVIKFIDYPMLYFKCDVIKYCISATDPECKQICDAGGRKRRQVNSKNSVNNITTSTWVFPYAVSPTKPTIKETAQDASSFKSCLDNTYVQISFILLLILMLVSFFTALCFCCLFRRHGRREKELDKSFYQQRAKRVF